MEEKDLFNELLKTKLDNLESPVRADVWSNVASSITSTSSTVSTGLSLLSKIAIGVSIVAATVTGVLLSLADEKSQDENTVETPMQPEQVSKEKNQSLNPNVQSDSQNELKNTQENIKKISSPKLIFNKKSDILSTQNISNTNGVIMDNTKGIQQQENKVEGQSNTSIIQHVLVNNEIKPDESTTLNSSPINSVKSELEITLPNIFTPNGDGVNDELIVDLTKLVGASIVVMNLKGQVIFTYQGSDFKWDGRDKNGDLVPDGSYMYFVTGDDNKGILFKKYSNLEVKY